MQTPNAKRQQDHDRASVMKPPSTAISVVPGPKMLKKQSGEDIHYPLYAGLCSDVEAVRKHLDSEAFSKRMKSLREDFRRESLKHLQSVDKPRFYGNTIVILVACAMSLGASISLAEMDVARGLCKKVGLMRDALIEMEKTLDFVHGYKNGTSWKFGSMGTYIDYRDFF